MHVFYANCARHLQLVGILAKCKVFLKSVHLKLCTSNVKSLPQINRQITKNELASDIVNELESFTELNELL